MSCTPKAGVRCRRELSLRDPSLRKPMLGRVPEKDSQGEKLPLSGAL
jgi:hypothetical protein